MSSLSSLISNLIDILMIFGPSTSFLLQISKIKKEKSSSGFSKKIILILLSANILRIYFWFGEKFSIILFIQSLIMILTQLYLLYTVLSYQDYTNSHDENQEKSHTKPILLRISVLSPLKLMNNFWEWKEFIEYLIVLFIFNIFLMCLSAFFTFDNKVYITYLGGSAAGIEALIGIPQIYKNCINKSTGSLSVGMIIMWLFGDSFKTVYFILNKSPIQLVYCGVFQLITDCFIIFQILLYKNRKENKEIDKKSDYDKIEYQSGVLSLSTCVDDNSDSKLDFDDIEIK